MKPPRDIKTYLPIVTGVIIKTAPQYLRNCMNEFPGRVDTEKTVLHEVPLWRRCPFVATVIVVVLNLDVGCRNKTPAEKLSISWGRGKKG